MVLLTVQALIDILRAVFPSVAISTAALKSSRCIIAKLAAATILARIRQAGGLITNVLTTNTRYHDSSVSQIVQNGLYV